MLDEVRTQRSFWIALTAGAAGMLVVILLSQSWRAHLDATRRDLQLQSAFVLNVVEAVILEEQQSERPEPAAPVFSFKPATRVDEVIFEVSRQPGIAGPALTTRKTLSIPRLQQAIRMRVPDLIGTSEVHLPSGKILFALDQHQWSLSWSAEAEDLSILPVTLRALVETRSNSPITGLSVVSTVSAPTVITTFARHTAAPAGLALAIAGLLVLLLHRLNIITIELRRANRHALEDTLSGLPNRRAFEDAFKTACRSCQRDRRPLSMLFIDIDRFKTFNDEHGHDTGDRALHAVAQAIRHSVLRPADFCCRWGGEEFVVLLPDTDPVGALETAERLIERVRGLRLLLEGGGEVNITVSVGIATASPERAVNRKELLARADAAMLDAKRSGRNRWSVCPADDAITPTGATP